MWIPHTMSSHYYRTNIAGIVGERTWQGAVQYPCLGDVYGPSLWLFERNEMLSCVSTKSCLELLLFAHLSCLSDRLVLIPNQRDEGGIVIISQYSQLAIKSTATRRFQGFCQSGRDSSISLPSSHARHLISLQYASSRFSRRLCIE